MPEIVCAEGSAAAGEALIGSAPDAIAWVCLEQNGPWGAKAWTDSHLQTELGRAIENAAGSGIYPGRHADPGRSSERHLLIGYTHPDGPWLLTGTISEPEALLELDWAAVASGDRDAVVQSLPVLVASTEPQLLVCTNGTRDTCCARLGRPVALDAAETFGSRVWEVTHTSGHRFAATTVLLPSGVASWTRPRSSRQQTAGSWS
jgi:hypothetical protein